MPYDFVANSFYAKKLCSRHSSSELRFYTENGCFAFWASKGNLRATYNDHLRLTGVVDFLLVLTEFIFGRCYCWGATSEYRYKIDNFASTGAGWPKISGRRGRPTNDSSSQKTRL